METLRQPWQGVWNIVRFNWHFYLLAAGFLLGIILISSFLPDSLRPYAHGLGGLAAASVLVTLVVSWYVYDASGLYQFAWLAQLSPGGTVLNINAGFDETSNLLQQKLRPQTMWVLDFYDPEKHTEVSIKRARRAYPPHPATQPATTGQLPLPARTADRVFVIFAAHEVRDPTERLAFFQEICRVTKPGGQVLVMEHLRDWPNFLAYNLGFFHFHSLASWRAVFAGAGLRLAQQTKHTPFVSVFWLINDGASL
jgi:SAM-dependent methyltransferase